jgi:hypothetical protein
MPSSRPLNALNVAPAKSNVSQAQPPTKQPMSRISSMRRDWNDDPKLSETPQGSVNPSQDTDPILWSRSPSQGSTPKVRAPVKASTVSRKISDKLSSFTAQRQIYWISRLMAAIVESLGPGSPLSCCGEKPVHGDTLSRVD